MIPILVNALLISFLGPAAPAVVAPSVPILPSPRVTESMEGEYIEVRTCDVYTGPCFANAEVNEVGKEATVGWRIDSGAVDGVRLDGKSVVAVIRNLNTLGKPRTEVKALETVLFVDETADASQRDALRAFAQKQLGAYSVAEPLLRYVPIELATGCCDAKGCSKLRAGAEIAVDTRCVCEHDKHCGNETLFYPPLTSGVDILPAVATQHSVQSDAMSVRFTDRESRGAMTGRFRLAAADEATLPTTTPAASPARGDDADRKFKLAAIEGEAPKLPTEIPEAFAKLLDKNVIRLTTDDDKPVYDVWLRAEVPFLERAKDSLAIKLGKIPLGECVGVLRAYGGTLDYREDQVKAGYYALRYGIQPEDGDHMGTAPNRDFFLLTSFKDDKDVAAIGDMDKLGELSILAGEDHPVICHARPLDGDAPAKPALKRDDEKNLWILDLALTGKVAGAKDEKAAAQKLHVGLVLIGISDAL